MTDWIQKNLSIGNIIQMLILVATIIWMFAFVRSDVDRNTEWNIRQDQEHEQFMRQDVGTAQFNAIRQQLDRIEQKIED